MPISCEHQASFLRKRKYQSNQEYVSQILAHRKLKMREIMEAISILRSLVKSIYSIGYERTCSKLGAAFADNRPQKKLCDNLEGVFRVIQPQFERVLASFHNR